MQVMMLDITSMGDDKPSLTLTNEENATLDVLTLRTQAEGHIIELDVSLTDLYSAVSAFAFARKETLSLDNLMPA